VQPIENGRRARDRGAPTAHGPRHNRSHEVEGRDAASAARHAAGPRPANEAMTLQIKMIVSSWYTDELGNQSRIIKARD
jgi:hypothetical protein